MEMKKVFYMGPTWTFIFLLLMNSIEHIEIQNDYESESKLEILIANGNIDVTGNW